MPASAALETKPRLAQAMLQRARDAAVPCRWLTGDDVYDADPALRQWLEREGLSYVLAIRNDAYLTETRAQAAVGEPAAAKQGVRCCTRRPRRQTRRATTMLGR